ncbi:VanZ family protein [Tissierella sp.]|uniref:VanZ family protein n=1 Tax=Tissierella sp. TaxID=41274 RepID=UPI0028A79BED|nr:VanZ family protein [Tissierella sp.]
MSRGVTEKIVETIEKVDPDVEIKIRSFNHTITKYAHFFSYLVLGVFWAAELRSCGVNGYKIIGFTTLICLQYAHK